MTEPIAVLGIDLGKNSCSLAGLDARGGRHAATDDAREGVAFSPGCRHAWLRWKHAVGRTSSGRTFAAQGHTVRLMSPEYVAPYVKAQKTDNQRSPRLRRGRRCGW